MPRPEKLTRVTKRNVLKTNILQALEKTLGNVTQACKLVNIARKTFYEYYHDDIEFAKNVDSINELALDFAESMLMKNIGEGKETSTIFYLKTKGKKRGYVETFEHNVNQKQININIEVNDEKTAESIKNIINENNEK